MAGIGPRAADRRLPEAVRASCAGIVAGAQAVRIDQDALERIAAGEWAVAEPGLDPERHFLDGGEADVAAYLLTLGAINFGSGWFPTLRKRIDPATGAPVSGYFTIAWGLTQHFRAHGPWTNPELKTMRAGELAEVLGQSPDHELMSLYAQALRTLGEFLSERHPLDLVAEAEGSAVTLAEKLARGMAMFFDRGFYKRAQLLPNDLALAGIAAFTDLDELTIFADNLVPHVLRCEGVLVYDDLLATHIDAGHVLPPGPWEREIRAAAVHACEQLAPRLGVAPRVLDTWLWNRGQSPRFKALPRHRCRSVYY